jgi:hypothetical protein
LRQDILVGMPREDVDNLENFDKDLEDYDDDENGD